MSYHKNFSMPLKTSFSKYSFRTNSYYFLNKKEIFFITVENIIVKTFEYWKISILILQYLGQTVMAEKEFWVKN